MSSSTPLHVGVLVGSLRRGSYSRRIAHALTARAPAGMQCAIIEIGELPLYNEDLDPAPPAAWVEFRKAVASCDALLFVTPEYNRSMPGCLKNATDIGSRPEGHNVFAGRPAAVVSVSPYALGGFGANHALRQSFVYLDLAVMQQPEAYIAKVKDLLGNGNEIKSAETDAFLGKFMLAFKRWIDTASSTKDSFETFLAEREKASLEYVNANVQPLLKLSATRDPATFFAPGGERVDGAANVNAANRKGAQSFQAGSTGHFEVMQSGASGQLGFWAGLQHASVMLAGKDEPVAMDLRVTEVFRVEDGHWRLVHRHADLPRKEK